MSPSPTVDLAALTTKRAFVHARDASQFPSGPPLDRAALEAFEQRMGVALPRDYAQFLVDVADGGAGPPAYGLYSLAEAVAESDKGIYSFAEPFEPPTTQHDLVDLEAPGMLLLGHQGCGYWDGLVLAGPETGTVWTFVEVRPGWIPIVAQDQLRRQDGQPFTWSDDYDDFYGVTLLPANRALRLSFSRYYEQWLDRLLAEPGPSLPEA